LTQLPNAEHRTRHALACTIAREAGALALDYFLRREALTIEAKANPQDVVSIADRDVETLIRERIAAGFPEDGVMGEEHAPLPSTSGYTWILDPIDGTSPFVMGLPDWCVSIAVHDGTRTVASAIHVPRLGDLYHAVLGGGAFLNDGRLAVDANRTVLDGLVGLGANFRIPRDRIVTFADRLLASGGMFYRNGSGALMLAYVAAGRLVGYFEPHINAWDCLAALLMIEEAGGYVQPYAAHGDLTRGDAVLAACPGAKNELLRLAHGLEFVS
jgi:myo-inositol-1(or 4)-monophosphatase